MSSTRKTLENLGVDHLNSTTPCLFNLSRGLDHVSVYLWSEMSEQKWHEGVCNESRTGAGVRDLCEFESKHVGAFDL